MDIERIEYPNHLDEPKFTDQELADMEAMPKANRAVARDWRRMNQKLDWALDMIVRIQNVQAEHDKSLATWNRVYWLLSVIGVGGLISILKYLGVFG